MRFVLTCALALGLAATAASAGEPDGAVLDWGSSYWSYHLTFRPPEMTGGGFLPYFRGWHLAPMEGRVRSADAPADWMKPQFDDVSWARDKGGPGHGNSEYEPVVRVKRLRGVFEVADPGRVSGLKLEIDFIGGAAVWLNGQEVARKFLPAGELTASVLAEGYSEEAYEWMTPSAKDGYPIDPTNWAAPAEPKAARWRALAVDIDAKLLRKGANVLAVALHGSAYGPGAKQWDGNRMGRQVIKGRAAVSATQAAGQPADGAAEAGAKIYKLAWAHLMVKKLSLSIGPAGAAARPAQPAGVNIRAEDIHRQVVNRDFFPADSRPVVLRLVGAKNGVYSAMALVETDAALAGLSAAAGELAQVGGGGKIPAEAVRVRYGDGLPLEPNLLTGSFDRPNAYFNGVANRILACYAKVGYKNPQEVKRPSKEMLDEARAIAIFDHIADRPPATVPAGTCQPVWVTVRVPKDAPAGEYRGTLTVNAGAAKTAEIRLQVMDWALPDSKDLSPFVGLQQSLFAACAQYKVAPWSDEHWKHLERTTRLLGEVGNDVAVLPLVVGGEGGNPESLVPWVKKGDSYDYDWKNLDRYLDLVARHWGTKAALVGEICWAPYTSKGWVVKHDGVTVLDGAGGKRSTLALPPFGSEEWNKLFVPFAKAVVEHCKAKGFEGFYWGWFYDGAPDQLRAAAETLAEACPSAFWARASHNGNSQKPFSGGKAAVKLDMHIRIFPRSCDKAGEPVSRKGWQQPGNVLFPRVASEIQAIDCFDAPMAYRWITENALVNGASGFGRIGADFWPPFAFANWYHPFENYVLCPGPDGADSGARFEAIREGVQEGEVRIWLEKNGKDQAEPAKTVLADRIRAVGALVSGSPSAIGSYYPGWQERSWDLYAAAAAAGGKAPSAEDKARFFGGK